MGTLALLSQSVPQPPSLPGSPHLFYLAREWAKRHSLILFCQGAPQPLAPEVRELFLAVEFLPPPPPATVLGKIHHRLRVGAAFQQSFRNPSFLKEQRAQFEVLLKSHQVEHLHVAQFALAELIPESLAPNQVTIDVTDDPELIHSREADLASSWWRRHELLTEGRSQAKFIQHLSRRGYALFVVGEADRRNLQTRWGVQAELAPLGIDADFFARPDDVERKPQLVFTGVMSFPPNVDTACRFAREIFPLLYARRPELEFLVVGADPSPEVRALESVPGVRVTGSVPDIRPFLATATAFVSPMRSGAGMKNKILAAMAMELPVIASTLGVAGIEVTAGEHYLAAEDIEEFVAHVEWLLEHPHQAAVLAAAAHAKVVAQYSWPTMAENHARHFLGSRSSGDVGQL